MSHRVLFKVRGVEEFQAAIFRSNVDDAHTEFQGPALIAQEHLPVRIALQGLFQFQPHALFADLRAASGAHCIPCGELNGKINGVTRASIFKSLHGRPVVRQKAIPRTNIGLPGKN
jgi:hypothetical protein